MKISLKYGYLGLAILFLPWVQSCSGTESESPKPAACSPDLASIQKNIFLRSCAQAGCHGAIEPAALLNLASEKLESELVGVASSICDAKVRVVPGDPDQSFLLEKISSDKPSCGTRMPPAVPLGPEDLACIQQWIQNLEGQDAGVDAPPDACETCGGAACVDWMSDPAHCGACNQACPPGASCSAGACQCSGGLSSCGSACVDTSQDSAHCGACNKACPSGALCGGGQCTCPAGQDVCADACVDKSSDPMNCGVCGTACGPGKVCNMGMCAMNCGMLTKCGASCVDTQNSADHCGACGNACAAGASCIGGICQCPAGTMDCGSGCINTETDPSNCGGCGKICAQGTTCMASACMCPGGGTVCGASCVDTQVDPANCGGCGVACALGQSCTAGACACGNASVSFSADVQPIFTASCANNGCHKGIMPAQGLDLSMGKSYAALVNINAGECMDGRKRVLPGQPSQSYLIDKMMGVDLCFGTQMPKLGLLPSAQIETVANWICSGAPNN